MIPLLNMDTIQIEITNVCINKCANCSRFVQFVKKPFMMDFSMFKKAINSMEGYPNMTGIQGGEPLLHPDFEKFCKYALSKIPREQLGLWTCLPSGYEKYREVICETFGNIFINDHSRTDIFHHPFLVAARDMIEDYRRMYTIIDGCFFQRNWSASINPKGAYFCEMAASFSMLYPDSGIGWRVEEGWWNRTPKDYTSQIEEFCMNCGGSLFLKRRSSKDSVTDISLTNLGLFKKHSLVPHNCELYSFPQIKGEEEQEPLAAYKDQNYRDLIAMRYGITLTLNEKKFNEPNLVRDVYNPTNVLSRYKERYM